MPIAEDKIRTLITMPKELKAKLEEIADKENRTFNNLIVTILKRYVEKQEQ